MSLGYSYHRPSTLAEAIAMKADLAGARYVAGGTDLIVRIKSGVERPPALISLRSIPELTAVQSRSGGLRIGAGALLGDLLDHPEMGARHPALREAIAAMGSVQIRNSATLGGNLCNASPAADAAPPLLVYEAEVEVLGSDGAVGRLPIDRLFVGPGRTALQADAVLTAITLPTPDPELRSLFMRKQRVHMDLAITSLAVALRIDGAGECRDVRVAAGAVAPVPLRLRAAEGVLEGRRPTEDLLAKAADAAMDEVAPISDVRAQAGYRRRIVGVFVRRAVAQLTDRGRP